jgi:NAD(P)-dependent dehydrogenase (short-subunit alcohol dehydrogenase family)
MPASPAQPDVSTKSHRKNGIARLPLISPDNSTACASPCGILRKAASIINLSSTAGRLGFPLRTPYAASKWAVVGFTKSLAVELGPLNIRVNAIQRGPVEGDRIRRVFAAKAQVRGVSLQTIQDEALSHASIKELIAPQQLADMMLLLASPRGRTISGQAISICGDVQSLF